MSTAPIKPRRMDFDMSQLKDKYFFHGNPILSTLMYALSASFPDGERFDPERNASGHVAFGFGNHFCLGAALARLEARIALERILAELPEARLAGPAERHGSFLVRGPSQLPLAFAA